ncbi:acetamidase/formamidase family protein [Nevskia sp.]|uniref:acetamidase/formamidase family protein n=1 Tax=Nevskia sp. TaxID=1929292 RepID=UPI003F7204A7
MNTESRRVQLPTRLAALLLLGALALPARAGVVLPKADHWLRLTPENSVIGNFPAQKAPILTVKSGATVRIDGGGGNRWGEEEPFAWLKANGVTVNAEEAEAIREIDAVVKKTERYADIKTGHLLVGPIAIEGAMPGDTIEVRVLKVTPRIPYGTVSQRPGRGGIPDDVKEPHTVVVTFDGKRRSGHFGDGIEVPLGPFQGVMGLLPAASEGANRRSGPPGLFGGNLDCKELVDGTSLYLPVFHPGGLFFTGDSHAAQGDGEVTVNAIETANTSVLQFILHKGRLLSAPRAESATHFIAFGLDPDLDSAMQMAIRETNTLLGDTYGLDFAHAFALSSIAIDFRVTQVVDETKGIHSMIPKSLFTQAKLPPFWAANGKRR